MQLQEQLLTDEVKDYLTKTLNPNPFDYEETKQSILFYTLYKIKKEIHWQTTVSFWTRGS